LYSSYKKPQMDFGKINSTRMPLVWALYGKNIKGVSEVNTWKRIPTPKDYKGTLVEVFFSEKPRFL